MHLTFCEKVFHRFIYPFGKCLSDLVFNYENLVILSYFTCRISGKGNCSGRRIGIKVEESEVKASEHCLCFLLVDATLQVLFRNVSYSFYFGFFLVHLRLSEIHTLESCTQGLLIII